MAVYFRNFTAATRKPLLKQFSLVSNNQNLDYIDGVAVASPTREYPSGTKNGTNLAFTISTNVGTLYLVWRGILLEDGVGYTRSGTGITMTAGYAPLAEDSFEAIIFP